MSKLRVAVVIPVYNRRDLLIRLLERLAASTYPIEQIVVVDNGSQDGAAEAAEQRGAMVIRMGSNAGFARAVNRGIAECRTEAIALVNSDVEPEPDWLEKLAIALEPPDVWFATGKILSAQDHARIDGAYDRVCRGGTAWRVGHARLDSPVFSTRQTIWSASATCALYKTELFRLLGTFDERLESYLEDVDFSLRCARAGLSGIYLPEAVAYHVGSASLGRWHPQTVWRIARNQVCLLAKHYPSRLLIRYFWSIVVAQGLWVLVACRHGRSWAAIRGKLSGLRQFRRFRALHWTQKEPEDRLRDILSQGEREIRLIQQKTGFDLYWRMYFLLTGGGAN